MFKSARHEHIYNALMASGEVQGERFVLRIAEIAAEAAEEALPGFPKGAGRQEPSALVQIMMPERIARALGVKLNGPLLFDEDDLPTYMLD